VSLQLNPLEPHIVSLSVAEAKTTDLKQNIEQRGREEERKMGSGIRRE